MLVACCLAALPAGAIVSERHLRGVKALDCDLEAGRDARAATFRLIVHAKERMLQLAGRNERFAYQEASDSALRFRLALGQGAPLECELELPAGALACATAGGSSAPQLGLCLPSE